MFLRYWLPLLLWMGLIYSASADSASGVRSSRIIGPLLHWLFPDISDATADVIVVVVRKCAHVVEYALLSFLFWRALWRPARKEVRPWSWGAFGATMLFVLLYAATDEFHQLFVESREGSVRDVVIDTAGGALGLLLAWGFFRLRRRG